MRSFVWVVVAIAATLTLMARAARAGDDPLPRPTYEIGHIWPLADSMYELVRLDDDVYVFASPNGEIRLTKSLGLVGVRRDEDFVEVSPGAQLTWPLKPGDWGTSRTEWSASRPTPTPWGRQKWGMAARRMTWSVEGWDDIALGSKTVRAVRIVYQMLGDTLAAREVLEWEITMWYAPDAGGFVRAVDRSFGIVNFELAPSADLVALRMRAGVPGLGRPAATSPDSARRHRDAARDTCGLLRCAPAASQPSPPLAD